MTEQKAAFELAGANLVAAYEAAMREEREASEKAMAAVKAQEIAAWESRCDAFSRLEKSEGACKYAEATILALRDALKEAKKKPVPPSIGWFRFVGMFLAGFLFGGATSHLLVRLF